MSQISEYARGLRLYAEWLEENGDRLVELHPHVAVGGAIQCVCVDTRDELAAVAALMGRIDRVEDDSDIMAAEEIESGHFTVSFYRDFGPGVSFYAFGDARDLCDHVIHEKPQWVTKRTVTWCPPPLLEATTPVAA